MSKKNRTINNLNDNISNEFAWRVKELSDYKGILKKSNESQKKTLLRGGIVLLYAHWEGFVKQATSHYYNYVSTRRHILRELSESFIACSLRNHLELVLLSNKISKQIEGINYILDGMDKRAKLPSRLPIKTSNLNYDIFFEYCQILGLDTTKFELRKNFIDLKLVKNRHEIAHGNYLAISIDDFEEIYYKTVELLTTLKNEIINSATSKKFKSTR